MFRSDSCRSTNDLPVSLVVVITGLNANGAEIMLLKLMERIDRSRFSPHVISLSTIGEIGSRIQSLGIPVNALGLDSISSVILGLFRLAWRIKRINPKLVHTWMYHADLIGGIAARLAGVTAITWGIVQSNLSPDVNKQSTLIVVRACAILSRLIPKRILSCSSFARQIHVNYGYREDKFVVLPLGFDLTRFKPDVDARSAIRIEFGMAASTPLVGLVGRFDPQKNHLGFIDACALIHKQRPDVHFLLVGRGVDGNNVELNAAIAAKGIEEVVHLAGAREDIPRVMAALDLLASSSIGEGFPNVLGESMASGVPCAVTNVGDSAYVVGDTGLVVESRDMPGLANALLQLLAMEKHDLIRLGNKARGRVGEHFEIDKVVRRYEKYYEGLLDDSFESAKC